MLKGALFYICRSDLPHVHHSDADHSLLIKSNLLYGEQRKTEK